MAGHPKPGSHAQREALRREMLEVGCSHAEIVAEIRTRWRMRPREAWRHAHGWTLQQAADRIDAVAASRPDHAVAADASLVGKWEKWPAPSGRRPSVKVLTLLAEIYGCTPEVLLDLDDRRALPATDLSLLRPPSPPVTALPAPSISPPQTPVQPPTSNGLVHAIASQSADWAQWAEATNVGDIALEQLLADAQSLANSYVTDEPLHVFSRTAQLRDRVFALLKGHQYPRQAVDLYTTAGYLCGLLAWISSDLGHTRDAGTQSRTAWLCAELAGNNDLRAWILSTRSKIAFWDGRLRDAVTFARMGAACNPRGTAGILLACQEADAWSVLGDRQQAQTALVQAAEAREKARGADELGGLFSCSDFRSANYSAAVLLRIGAAQDALREANEAFADRRQHAYGTVAQIRIVQASAHLALGEPEGTAAAIGTVLAMPPHQRLAPVIRRVGELAADLARSPMRDSAPASNLQAEIEAWSLKSVSRTLSISRGQEAI
ncbi:helix-turn-helix domain-containing protein [Nonomuraea sp. NPDC003754]